MSSRADSSGPESRLERVLAEYLRSVDEGRPIDRAVLLATYPDLADELQSFFRNRDAIARMSEPFQGPPSDLATVAFGDRTAEAAPRVRYFGDYEILAEIARGGMGVVYRARQVSLNRQVALKMILAGQLASPARAAISDRGRSRRQPRSPEHRAHLRGRPTRGTALFHHETGRGRESGGPYAATRAVAPRRSAACSSISPARCITRINAASCIAT